MKPALAVAVRATADNAHIRIDHGNDERRIFLVAGPNVLPLKNPEVADLHVWSVRPLEQLRSGGQRA